MYEVELSFQQLCLLDMDLFESWLDSTDVGRTHWGFRMLRDPDRYYIAFVDPMTLLAFRLKFGV